MKTSRLILLTIFLAVSAAWSAFAAVYYVDIANGDNGNLGQTPGIGGAWQTLHYAAATTYGQTGHTIHVAPGTYSVANGEPDALLDFNLTNSSILGDAGGGTILDATSFGRARASPPAQPRWAWPFRRSTQPKTTQSACP